MTAVQLVNGMRDPRTGKVKQHVIRHIGSADNEPDLLKLKELGEYIKAQIIDETTPTLFTPETMSDMALNKKSQEEQKPQDYKVDDMRDLRTEQSSVTGIHEIYGLMYNMIGFDKILSHPARKVHTQEILRHIVLARIANPQSKRETVRLLEQDFGIHLKLDAVYKAMNHLEEKAIEKIQKNSLLAAQKTFKESIDVLFYDATTLYFESFTEDALKSKGFSKDNKFNEVQVMLSLFVTKEGIPIGYEVFPGSTYEGHTLISALENLKTRFTIENVVFVADSGMLNKENISLLEEHGYQYIVGARIKNMKTEVLKDIFNLEGYKSLTMCEDTLKGKVIELPEGNVSLVVSHSEKRARKDAHDREESLKKLMKKMNKSKDVKSMLSNSGYKKYLIVDGQSNLQVDEEKIASDSRWDGLHGVITNMKNIDIREVISQYKGLWQVEETFRVSKHDLKVRPIYHWTEQKIKAHIALCFMSLVCIRHLEHRVNLQGDKMSPERIRKALLSVGITTARHIQDKRLFALPFQSNDDAKIIYKTLDRKISKIPYLI
jgi:transposase